MDRRECRPIRRGAQYGEMSTRVQTIVGGRYRLERQIGAGATARVWLAFDNVLERRVAVKMLDTPLGGESAHVERFRREARAVAKLQHPHIVTVLDSGEHDGMPFIVLEYVEGETLKERIRRVGRLTVTEAVAFTIEVARALDAAHSRGIVHRDVKPQNILLDAEGGAKITDFGIARSGNEDGLTVGGRVLGTTDYVSPEQALGHEVTGQSDLYSLGVVLYESLTGTVPFSAASHIAVATMHVREEIPDVQLRRPDVSAALAAVVERATAKHLGRRYTGARELIADLEEALAIETARTGNAGKEATLVLRTLPAGTTRRVPMRVRHPMAMAAAVTIAVAIAGGVTAFLLTRTHPGTGAPPNLARSSGEVADRLAQVAATQYNPFGTSPEDPNTVGQAIDGNTATFWQTSTYTTGKLGKSGVGFYVDAKPQFAANLAVLQTPTPGFHVQIWGTDHVAPYRYNPTPRPGVTPAALGWTQLASALTASTTRIPLGQVRERRYYLVWITDLGPDPHGGPKSVEIAEFTLFGARP
jgi:tRNA A-37 threonylcarbamoyl transferase component Bud32